MSNIQRILIFTKGGLLGIVDISKENVEFKLEWPEDFSINGMALVATLISVFQISKQSVITFDEIMKYAPAETKILFGERGIKVLRKPYWLAYISENSDYILVAELDSSGNRESVIRFLKELSEHIRDAPEEAIMVCTEALQFAWERLKGSS
ncbi:MAG: hypothetical protein Q6363_000120, partial [Candidatus Njordarchaeota archaeon]